MKKVLTIFTILAGCFLLTGCVEGFEKLENFTKESKFSYEVTKEYTDSIGTRYIEGTVKNETDREYSYVQIDFVCYDKDGNNLGTAMDNTNNLLGNETWKFKAMGLFSGNGKVDHCNYKEVTGW